MALSSQSLILYGLEVTDENRSIDFKNAALGPTLQATLRLGFYSLSSLATEIVRSMQEVDTTYTYTVTTNRTISAGTQNRVTIATSGGFLSLLFATGPRAASTVAPLIGFPLSDQTGATSYTGNSSAGTPLVPDYIGYNYLGPDYQPKVFGNVNVSASGLKEAIVFQNQRFVSVQFKYEPKSKIEANWVSFVQWAIQQRPFDFTPEVSSPSIFYEVTLESTTKDAKGLAWAWREMLPDLPNRYDSGILTLRLTPS